MEAITEKDILEYIGGLMRFPFPQICRHLVAADLLELLESKGWKCPLALAKAVVDSNDEGAVAELAKLGIKDA